MLEMDGSSKPPQISEMLQKFAVAFKTRTFEFFADDEDSATAGAASAEDSDGFSLLDSAEEVITDQKVVVIKPDPTGGFSPRTPPSLGESPLTKPLPETPVKSSEPYQKSRQKVLTKSLSQTHFKPVDIKLTHNLIASVIASVSSFEASYFQLQTAHVPFVEENVKVADRALVSHLRRLSEFKKFYMGCCRNLDYGTDFPVGSLLEADVEENQSKLRTLGTVSNRLQIEIEQKDNEVSALRKKLSEIQNSNVKLSKKLSGKFNSSFEVLLTVKVFESVLRDACRATHSFSKLLIDLMRKAGWDLDLAANTVHPDIEYAKKGHNRFALRSYICLGMFQDFASEEFGLSETKDVCNGDDLDSEERIPVKQLLEHVSSNPMELLSRDPNCHFSRYCEKKYHQLIHPTMESSIFSNLEQTEIILNSWRSLSVFYESFLRMASSIWTLHKLSFSFDPVVEIFQVERGAEFSMIYMADVTRKISLPTKSRPKVAFTVFPGFKIRRTVIQSQVYLSGLRCTKQSS